MSESPNSTTGGAAATNITQLTNDFKAVHLPTDKPTHQQLSEQADALLLQYLELYQQYKQLQAVQLNDKLKQCNWSLTELRHTSSYYSGVSSTSDSAKLLSSACYADRTDIHAMYTVSHNSLSNALQLEHRTKVSAADTTADGGADSGDSNDSKVDDDSKSIEPVLRQRKPLKTTQNKNDAKFIDSQPASDALYSLAADTPSTTYTDAVKIDDPIKWFTSLRINYLKLQQTQKQYQSVLYTVVSLCNIQLQMQRLEAEYSSVRKQLDALHNQ